MTRDTVLIAGAGPTGLVLANWLARLGVGFRIIDKESEPGTTSRALAGSPRSLSRAGIPYRFATHDQLSG
jgi:2-polyprenyl-6-methoxyphenol hydroxylase-like FAD-dependent oxidoreductase